MSSMDILNKIKESEEEGESIRREALADARAIMSGSEEETDRLIEDNHKMTLDKARNLMEEAEAKAKEEIKNLESATKDEIERLKARSKNNEEEAVSFVLGRIVGNYGSN